MRRGKPVVGPAGSSRQRNNGLLPKWALDLSEQLRIIKYPAHSKIQWKWVCLLPFSPVWALIQKCPFRFRTVACAAARTPQVPSTEFPLQNTLGRKGLKRSAPEADWTRQYRRTKFNDVQQKKVMGAVPLDFYTAWGNPLVSKKI